MFATAERSAARGSGPERDRRLCRGATAALDRPMDRPGVSRAGRGVACEEERAGERFRPVELGGVAPGDRVREAAPSVGIGTPIDEPDLGRPAANSGKASVTT